MKRAPISQTLVLFAVSLLATALPAQDFLSKVDEYMQAEVKTKRFTGAILVARDGKTLVAKGYGMANLEHGVPNTTQTKFRLGSITKQFTSMAIVMLEEKGKLSVQDPICKYVSDCPPAWTGVTIHHLLTHTSGIPSFTNMPDYRDNMVLPVTPDKMLTRFRDKPLEFQPNEKYKYSNSGYFLLGVIIEKASGQGYEEFLRANIFEPLGMKNSGYDRSDVILKDRAAGYALAGAKVINAPYLDMSQPYAAGSLYSTVEDLLVWDQALYTEKLVKKKSLEMIFTPVKDNYAYGWTVTTRFNRRYVGHGGGINGFVTDISRYPDDRLCVVVLSNLNGVQPARISRDLAAIAYGEKYEIPVK